MQSEVGSASTGLAVLDKIAGILASRRCTVVIRNVHVRKCLLDDETNGKQQAAGGRGGDGVLGSLSILFHGVGSI